MTSPPWSCPTPELSDDGEEIGYVIGYTFVPAYMRGKLADLPPVSAVDAAHSKRPGVGTVFAEACVDSERRIHPIFISHIMCTENQWAYRTAFQHATEAHGPAFLARNHVRRWPFPVLHFRHGPAHGPLQKHIDIAHTVHVQGGGRRCRGDDGRAG